MAFTVLDYVICGLAVLPVVIGLFRGFSGELGSIAGFVAGAVAGFALYDLAGKCVAMSGCTLDPGARRLVVGVVDFVFALVTYGAVRYAVAKFVSFLVPQPTNALLGLLGGVVKAVVLLALLTGVGFMKPGTYSQNFLVEYSQVIRLLAGWADAYLPECLS